MNNEEFEQIVEKVIKTTSNDVTAATDVAKREVAVKNFKMAADIMLEHRKNEYSHEENIKRIDNENSKIKKENERFNTEMDLKYAQLQNDIRKQKIETIVKIGLYAAKAGLLIFGETAALRFEVGGNWTSNLRSLFQVFGRTMADDVMKIN